MLQEKKLSVILLAALAAGYCLAVFPLLFFRHDDWWILGNSVRYLPQNWTFLWKPSLYYGGREIVWFFRPSFKLLTYLFYGAFGFHYTLWMAAILGIYLATVWLGYATCERLTGQVRNGFWFVGAIAGSLLIHFGSLAWMGEGLMNVPQAFFLMVCTYSFVRAQGSAAGWLILSWVSFAASLCCKESSLFHAAFLAGMVCAEPVFRRLSWKQRVGALLPFAVLAAAYVGMRFGLMTVSPSYRPEYTLAKLLRSTALAVGPVVLPLAIWAGYLRWQNRGSFRAYLQSLSPRLFYLPFVSVSLVVYLGHDFFSPGWSLVVGTFTLLALAFAPVPAWVTNATILRFSAVLFLVSAVPVAWRLNAVGWWHWHRAQREVFVALSKGPADLRWIFIRPCENPAYPEVFFERVVASEEGLRQMWFLTHGKSINVQFLYCHSPMPTRPNQWVIDWTFPSPLRISPTGSNYGID